MDRVAAEGRAGGAPRELTTRESSEAQSGQMCFYRPLNETNEWGPWPQRGEEGCWGEKQLPRVSLEA